MSSEVIGHREAALGGQTRNEVWHEELQASVRAALHTPDLPPDQVQLLTADAAARRRPADPRRRDHRHRALRTGGCRRRCARRPPDAEPSVIIDWDAWGCRGQWPRVPGHADPPPRQRRRRLPARRPGLPRPLHQPPRAPGSARRARAAKQRGADSYRQRSRGRSARVPAGRRPRQAPARRLRQPPPAQPRPAVGALFCPSSSAPAARRRPMPSSVPPTVPASPPTTPAGRGGRAGESALQRAAPATPAQMIEIQTRS